MPDLPNLHEYVSYASLVTDILPAALSVWLFVENRRLKRLVKEKELQLVDLNIQELELDLNVSKDKPIIIMDDSSPRNVVSVGKGMKELFELERLRTERDHLIKLLGKDD